MTPADRPEVNITDSDDDGLPVFDDPRHPPPPPEEDVFSRVLHGIVTPALFSIIVVLGVGGNSLVIYVIVSRERMRTVTNILLLNLGMADLLFVLFVPSFTAYQFATTSWPFGGVVCKLMHYIVNVTAYVTVYTLVLIAAVRYMTIVHGISTARLRTARNAVGAVGALWAAALLVNVPVLTAYGVVYDYTWEPQCQTYQTANGRVLFGTFFVFAYLFPLAAIALLSICIVRHLTKHRSEILERKNRANSKTKRAGLLLIVVVVAFAVLWLPIHIYLLLAFFESLPYNAVSMSVGVACRCLAYGNSCINPFIYNCTSKDFRDAFRDVICRGARSDEELEVVVHSNTTQLQTSLASERIQLCDVNGDAMLPMDVA